MKNKVKKLLLQLADNNSFSEEIIKKEFPELFFIQIPLSEIRKNTNDSDLGAVVRKLAQ